MGYKDTFKVGDLVSTDNDIDKAVKRDNFMEIIGYRNIRNVFHLITKSYGTGYTSSYPAMYAERELTNYGKKQVVELLWIRK